MVETQNKEIDIEQLMTEIRQSLAERNAEGGCSINGTAAELPEILLNIRDAWLHEGARWPIRLQPHFVPRNDDHYHVDDLLQFYDKTFVWNAYRAILKREPDEWGLNGHLQSLRSGEVHKIDVLGRLRFSSEGRSRGVKVKGLLWRSRLRRLFRIPVLGYLLEAVATLARLPKLVRSQRQFEGYVTVKLELLTSLINKLAAEPSQSTLQSPEQRHAIERLTRVRDEIEASLVKSNEKKTKDTPD